MEGVKNIRKRIRIGDIFEIPLSDGRKAYGQYVFWDQEEGPLIQVFDLILEADEPSDTVVERLQRAKPLFPPVITGLQAAIRTGMWTIIGHSPIKDFKYPGFISVYHDKYIPRGNWLFWDGEQLTRLGSALPEEYKDYEFLVGWSPYDIPHRIETGENPYEEMIRKG